MKIMETTKMYKNHQTLIPKKIREEYNITEESILTWEKLNDEEIKIKVRRKRNINELRGMVKLPYKTNSVELKRSMYE
ncbi:MAG: hypothetical protein IJJ47_00590 [Methanosphaera sp.]|nr:hypothetical protein [Methanosphaera sp.]